MADNYTVLVQPLSEADGGGFEAIIPELPGCMSDGETPKEAVENVAGAIESWKEAAEELGRDIPAPGSSLGQWRQRVPKSLHIELKKVAEAEGVSLNSLVSSYLAESLGRRHTGG
jgi:antitoxin HicB